MRIVAEGLETEEQFELIKEYGAGEDQGFHKKLTSLQLCNTCVEKPVLISSVRLLSGAAAPS
jgi:EAL domain-containing protein (putative c-di-GMP-specific phosphodiesterase class I)